MMPACSHTGTPDGFDGLRHFTVSTTSGSASRISARSFASISPRQPPSSAILASINCEAEAASSCSASPFFIFAMRLLSPPYSSNPSPTSGRLKQLDHVAGRVFQQDLRSSRSRHDVVPEFQAMGSQPLDLGGEVVHHQLETVPAARLRALPVRHRPPRGTLLSAQQQPERPALHIGEGGRGVGYLLESEMRHIPV